MLTVEMKQIVVGLLWGQGEAEGLKFNCYWKKRKIFCRILRIKVKPFIEYKLKTIKVVSLSLYGINVTIYHTKFNPLLVRKESAQTSETNGVTPMFARTYEQ